MIKFLYAIFGLIFISLIGAIGFFYLDGLRLEREASRVAAANVVTAPPSRPPDISKIELCSLGTADKEEVVVGGNFFSVKLNDLGIDLISRTWLRCAQDDIAAHHFESARMRLEQIIPALKQRNGSRLILASSQFRFAYMMLVSNRWADALPPAQEAVTVFDEEFPRPDAKQQARWLSWPGYDERKNEPLISLQILTRAYRVNNDPRWEPTLSRALTIAKDTWGEDSDAYRTTANIRRKITGQ